MHPSDTTLSEYVDRGLNRDEQAEVARHLETCEVCRGLVDDLREIARAAAALDPMTPPATAWDRIERQIRSGHVRAAGVGRAPANLSAWTWLAAATVLVIAVFVGVRFAPPATPDAGAIDGTSAAETEAIETELKLAEEHYQNAISGLERIASAENETFDADTAATLKKNLGVINQAIDESRAAVRAEPGSEQAQSSLIENFKTKLALLQDTVALINELRAGDETAAARIVSGS